MYIYFVHLVSVYKSVLYEKRNDSYWKDKDAFHFYSLKKQKIWNPIEFFKLLFSDYFKIKMLEFYFGHKIGVMGTLLWIFFICHLTLWHNVTVTLQILFLYLWVAFLGKWFPFASSSLIAFHPGIHYTTCISRIVKKVIL